MGYRAEDTRSVFDKCKDARNLMHAIKVTIRNQAARLAAANTNGTAAFARNAVVAAIS